MASLSFFDPTWMVSSFWITFAFKETLSHSLPSISMAIMFVAICFSSGILTYVCHVIDYYFIVTCSCIVFNFGLRLHLLAVN